MKPSAFNAAFTILTASCTLVQLPCAWGFFVLRAVVRPPRLEQYNKCCSSGSVDNGTKMPGRMTRAGALSVYGGALVVAARNSLAAIPTADDYAFGTGSKVKRPRKGGEDGELSAPLPKTSAVNPNNLVEVVGAVSGELDRMQTLVEKERWGDALGRLRSFPLTALKSPTLGLGSVADVARSLGVSNAKAAEILEASVEAGLTLREVEDVIFSNTRTLEFYNSADLKQVEVLKKGAEPTDLSEPLQLLSETKALVRGVRDLMEGGAL